MESLSDRDPRLALRFENQSVEVESLRRKSQHQGLSPYQRRGVEFHLQRAQESMKRTGDLLWSSLP